MVTGRFSAVQGMFLLSPKIVFAYNSTQLIAIVVERIVVVVVVVVELVVVSKIISKKVSKSLHP